jgi:ketosteroid isomerase-like protein
MKRCPKCQSTYTDDTLRFCLQDGTPLVSVSGSASGPGLSDAEKTLVLDSSERRDEPPPTEILGPAAIPTIASPKSPVTTPQQPRPTQASAHDFAGPQPTPPHQQQQPTPKGKNTTLVIPITIAATVLVLAVVGVGAWLLLSNRNGAGPGNARNDGGRTTRTPATTNSSSPAASPATASPTPTPAASPVDAAAVRSEVTSVLNGWAQSSMAHDLDAHMSHYADRLDTYYTKSNVSASAVRADRERAYNTYSSIDIDLSNIEITPDAAGERATVVFDKTWNFEGEEQSTSGSVQQRLWLAKTNGRWRITGEKDLKVYYVNK